MSSLGRKSCEESGRLRDEPKLIKRLLLGAEFCVTYSKEEVFPAIPSSFFIVVDFLKVLIFFPGWLCHFKRLFILFGAKFTGRKFY